MRNAFIITFFIICFVGLSNPMSGQNIMTVRGKVPVSKLTSALPHEHVMTNFIGAREVKNPEQVSKDQLSKILPHYQHLKKAGIV